MRAAAWDDRRLGRVAALGLLIASLGLLSVGLFDETSLRSNISEHDGQFHGMGLNGRGDLSTECTTVKDPDSDGWFFPELGDCWHYRSHPPLSELVIVGVYRAGLEGYSVVRGLAVLVTTAAVLSLAVVIARDHGRGLGVVSGTLLLTSPMVAHYGRMYHPNTWIMLWMIGMAVIWRPLLGAGTERAAPRGRRQLGAQAFALLGPLTSPLAAFHVGTLAGLVLLHGRGSWPRRMVHAGLLVAWAFVGFFVMLWMADVWYGSTSGVTSRAQERSSLDLLLSGDFWRGVIDTQVGLVGLPLLLIAGLWIARRGRHVLRPGGPLRGPTQLELAAIPVVVAAIATVVIFAQAAAVCCPYMPYFGVLGLAMLTPSATAGLPWTRLGAAGAVALVLTVPMYLQWEAGPRALQSATLQEYILDEVSDDDDALVVIDNRIAAWTGTRWLMPNGTIHLAQDHDPADVEEIILRRQPDVVLVVNATNDLWELEDRLPQHDWCHTVIAAHPDIPDLWVHGWMSTDVPYHAWRPCASVPGGGG